MKLLLAIATATCMAAQAQVLDVPSQEDTSQRIIEIRVENNKRIEAAAVARALKQKVGDTFDRRRTAKDLQALWALKLFSDIQLLVQRTARGIAYVVRVTEKPIVRKVSLSGNEALDSEDFKDILDIQPLTILNLAAIKRNQKKIQDKYLEKGFFLAEVSYTITPSPDGNEVDLVFVINEHAKVEVTIINLLGARHIEPAALKSLLNTQEGGYLSFFTNQGTYREQLFQKDLQILQLAYLDKGFINVHLDKPIITLSPDKRYITITIRIEEGDQYSLGKLDFSQNVADKEEELMDKLLSREGMLFNRSRLARDIQAINDVYYDMGYAYANVTPITTVNTEKKVVNLTFNIQKGNLVSIERIDILGNTKTRDTVIRRQLRLYEGELFSGTGMRRSKEKITALGFFEAVDIVQKPGKDDKHVVIEVKVEEKSTGQFQLGLGFSNVESFIFTAQVSQQNFLGWGIALSANAQLSALRNFFQVQYFDPYFLDTNYIFSANLYRTQLDYFGFIRTATGGTTGFGYYLIPDELSLNLGYTLESVYLETGRTLDDSRSVANQFRSGITSSLRLSVTWDRRNNRLFPSSGWLSFLSFESAPSFLNAAPEHSQYNFNKITAYQRVYFPLPLRIIFKINVQVGYIQDINPNYPLPSSELYFLGGINTIRGYSLRSITPKTLVGRNSSPDSAVQSFGVGGNKQFVFNAELEFPLIEKVGIRGVLFYDAGNTFARNARFFEHIPNIEDGNLTLPLGLFHSFGFGVRWFSPIGPLRFEWGIPLIRRRNDQNILFEFNIGNSF